MFLYNICRILVYHLSDSCTRIIRFFYMDKPLVLLLSLITLIISKSLDYYVRTDESGVFHTTE